MKHRWHMFWRRHVILEKPGLVRVVICYRRWLSKVENSNIAVGRFDEDVMHDVTGLVDMDDLHALITQVMTADGINLWLESVGHRCESDVDVPG